MLLSDGERISRDWNARKYCSPIEVREGSSLVFLDCGSIFFNEAQNMNADGPIVITVNGSRSSRSEVHSPKALVSILSRHEEKIIYVILLQL